MKRSLKSPLALAILLTAIAGPVFAGNYAEGDPRPAPLTASASRAAVSAGSRPRRTRAIPRAIRVRSSASRATAVRRCKPTR